MNENEKCSTSTITICISDISNMFLLEKVQLPVSHLRYNLLKKIKLFQIHTRVQSVNVSRESSNFENKKTTEETKG